MKTLKELLAAMEASLTAVETAEAKLAENTDEGAKSYLTSELEAKTAEYEAAVASYDGEKRRIERRAKVEGAKKATPLESKTEELVDVSIPDSEHNRLVEGKKLDEISRGYLMDASHKAGDFMAKTARTDERAIDALRVAGQPGLKIPTYMREYIINPIHGKTYEDVARSMGAKGTAVVRVADASGTLSGGASYVPETFIPELYKLPQVTFRLVDKCRVKRAVGREAIFPRLAQGTNRYGVVATWGNEGATFGTDNPVGNELEVLTGRLGLLTQLSLKEMRVNQVGLDAELAWMMRGAWNEEVTKALLAGNGANNRPNGVNTNAQITAGVAVQARQTAAQVSYTDLVNLMFAVEDATVENGIFIMRSGSTGAAKYIYGLDDTDGRPVVRNRDVGWQAGIPQKLLGMDWFMTPDNAAQLGQRGDVIYGDWMNYAVAVDNDITIERSDHFAFDKGLATYRMHSYIGGKPLGPTCFAVLGDVSTASSSSSSSSSSST